MLGVTRLMATSPQSGRARTAAPTYVSRTSESAMNTFSARAYDPRTTISHTMNADTMTAGPTRRSLKMSVAAAMPANSATVTVPLATSKISMAKAVHLTPNCSRISSAKPLPVTTPMRAT